MNEVEALLNKWVDELFKGETKLKKVTIDEDGDVHLSLISNCSPKEFNVITKFSYPPGNVIEELEKYFYSEFRDYVEDIQKKLNKEFADEFYEYEADKPSIDDIAYTMGYEIDDDGHWKECQSSSVDYHWDFDEYPYFEYEEIDDERVYEYEHYLFFKIEREISAEEYREKFKYREEEYDPNNPFSIDWKGLSWILE
ncbi:hypothetical protein ACU1JV_00225 [Paenibacillus sp. T2-29]|uniref:Uncharacterized protein n=1 Tax=Paenibacillus peoriae TaxID=59893 RepID=A0A7H0Y2Q2_9BACL|nr:hypothetical protein [Paenibacillus peoriae]QNR65360.1 hypothetical protein IAQ67_15810 [Paenibacillus peoriae]